MKLVAVGHDFAGVRALADVTWEVLPGEIHGLVGSNGAGKSTLLAILCGELAPTRGQVVRSARRVAFVHQTPALLPELDVAENLLLGRDGFWISRRSRARRSRELLDAVGATFSPDRRAGSLSLPEQQQLEIARALRDDPDAIVFDEPTAALPTGAAERVFTLARDLASRGRAVVWVSHRLEEVLALADRVTVLRDGGLVGTWPRTGLAVDDLVRAMVGGALGVRDESRGSSADAAAPVRLALRGRIELDVHAGEVVTLFGLVGAGRTELLSAIAGLAPDPSLAIAIDGVPLRAGSVRAALRAGVALVPEDRRRDGIVAAHTVLENATLSTLRTSARPQREASARRRLAELAVRAVGEHVPIATLSGGNQQKVVLARVLGTAPKVLLLDEPTQGVDVAAKAALHDVVRGLARNGTAVLAACSDLEEATSLGARIVVLRSGRVAALVPRSAAHAEALLAAAFGTHGRAIEHPGEDSPA